MGKLEKTVAKATYGASRIDHETDLRPNAERETRRGPAME
jgi:hypothetical protein